MASRNLYRVCRQYKNSLQSRSVGYSFPTGSFRDLRFKNELNGHGNCNKPHVFCYMNNYYSPIFYFKMFTLQKFYGP